MLALYGLEFNWEKTDLGAVVHVCKHTRQCTGAYKCDGMIQEQAEGFEAILTQHRYKFPVELKTWPKTELRKFNA